MFRAYLIAYVTFDHKSQEKNIGLKKKPSKGVLIKRCSENMQQI